MAFFLLVAVLLFSLNDGDDIPLPTDAQIRYYRGEIVGLTHFNMGTYYGDSDPSCNANNWDESGNPANFNPYALNISNWIQSYTNLGANSAVQLLIELYIDRYCVHVHVLYIFKFTCWCNEYLY